MVGKADDLSNRLVSDVRSTQELRAKFKQDPKAGLKEAAQQFESMFMQMVLKSMRDATPQDGIFNSDETRFYTSMLDQQMAQKLSSGPGLGFAKLIEEQMSRHLQASAQAASTPPANAAAGQSLPLSEAPAQPPSSPYRLPPSAPRGPTVTAEASAAIESIAEVGRLAPGAKEFVTRVWPHAVEASKTTGIPPQFLVAHAALESGWGRSELKRADGATAHNLFGIKAGRSWSGETVEANTTEFVGGEAQRVNARFRAYGSYADSFRDYASLLRNNPRFGNVIGSQDGTEFARRLQQAGYATDPLYAEKLSRIIQGPTLRQALIG